MFKGWGPTNQESEFLKDNPVQVNNEWHINGHSVKHEKILVLGRSCYYMQFIRTLSKKLNKNIYQSDFMTWKDSEPRKNLAYYIDTADEIHFNLRGVTSNDVYIAAATQRGSPYMTSWEIKYIFEKSLQHATWWYSDDDAVIRILIKLGVKKIRRYKSISPEQKEQQILDDGYKYFGIV